MVPMDTTMGMSASATSKSFRRIKSEANTLPPGEFTRSTMAAKSSASKAVSI